MQGPQGFQQNAKNHNSSTFIKESHSSNTHFFEVIEY